MDKNLSEINTHLQDALAHCLRTADAIADCKPADAALSALQMSFAINKAESLMHSVRRQILKQVDTAASS